MCDNLPNRTWKRGTMKRTSWLKNEMRGNEKKRDENNRENTENNMIINKKNVKRNKKNKQTKNT